MIEQENVEIVNLVASGKFDLELDLPAVAEDLSNSTANIESVEHSRRRGNRLLIYFVKGDGLGILAPTGVYVINGVTSIEEAKISRQQLVESLAELGILSSITPNEDEIVSEFDVKNIVCTAEVDSELNLNAIAIGVGLENTEYEPEQFPGLIFRPDEFPCTILLFATGKIVITGSQNVETAERAYELVIDKIENFTQT